ncbi:MAG: cupin domain-containing protein, partial [Pontibacterium sp.]
MNINHHLDEATIVSYSAGALSQAMALVVATHLSMCPKCRARLHDAEAIGGALLDNMPSANIKEDGLTDMLAMLDMPVESDTGDKVLDTYVSAPEKAKQSASKSEVPEPLRGVIGDSFDDLPWKKIVGGVHYVDLPFQTRSGGVSRLLKISPGKSMLPHTHDGNELTLVLRGSFNDEIGR